MAVGNSHLHAHSHTYNLACVLTYALDIQFDVGVGLQEVTFQSLDTNGNAILDSDELEPHMLYETVRTTQHPTALVLSGCDRSTQRRRRLVLPAPLLPLRLSMRDMASSCCVALVRVRCSIHKCA